MNIDNLVQNITPELFERLQYGASTGKWPDGTPLSDAPLRKKPKKKKDPSPRNRRKNDAGKDRALATEVSSAKRLDQQDLDREPKEAEQ